MTRPYQGSEAWHEERRSGYGASDAPILIDGDEVAWRQLHGEKLGLLPPREASETMDLGKRLEAVILRIAAERMDVPIVRVNRIIRHRELHHVFASLDGRRKRGPLRPVEAKKWAFKGDEWGPEGSDQVPDRIFWQVQQQAAVTDADVVDVAVLFAGSKVELFHVGRDESEIDSILELETAAWAYVARGEMPPWPGEAAKRVYLREDEVPADEVVTSLVAAALDAKAAAERTAKEEAAVKSRLREVLADVGGARGVLPSGVPFTVSHRPNKDSSTTPWQQIAAGYRRRLLELGVPAHELDFAESALTTVSPGARPIRISTKEKTRHAA